jgi:hypothetical protein
MQGWDGKLTNAASVAGVMQIMGEFLAHLRAERQHALLPASCRHMVLTTPADIEWWLHELESAPAGYGTGRMILQMTKTTFSVAWQRLTQLGYSPSGRAAIN